jgi:hypothetical protein
VGLAIKLLRPLLFVHHAKLLCRWQPLHRFSSTTSRSLRGEPTAGNQPLPSRSAVQWPMRCEEHLRGQATV